MCRAESPVEKHGASDKDDSRPLFRRFLRTMMVRDAGGICADKPGRRSMHPHPMRGESHDLDDESTMRAKWLITSTPNVCSLYTLPHSPSPNAGAEVHSAPISLLLARGQPQPQAEKGTAPSPAGLARGQKRGKRAFRGTQVAPRFRADGVSVGTRAGSGIQVRPERLSAVRAESRRRELGQREGGREGGRRRRG